LSDFVEDVQLFEELFTFRVSVAVQHEKHHAKPLENTEGAQIVVAMLSLCKVLKHFEVEIGCLVSQPLQHRVLNLILGYGWLFHFDRAVESFKTHHFFFLLLQKRVKRVR
jgi:hypothetical protein